MIVPTGHLGNEHGGCHGVLVSGVSAAQIAVAFFEAEEEGVFAAFLEFLDFFADVFEAGEGLKDGDAVFFADGVGHGCGDQTLDYCGVGGKIFPDRRRSGSPKAGRRSGCR